MPLRYRSVRTAVFVLPTALLLTACDHPAVVEPTATRGARAPLTSNGLGVFSDFEPLTSSASCVAPPSTLPAFATYQPFVLPVGYAQSILLDEIGDFVPVAGKSFTDAASGTCH